MSFLEWMKQIVEGIVAGICSWLPVSFDGHYWMVAELMKGTGPTLHDLSSLTYAAAEIGVSISLLFVFSYKLNPIAAGKTLERRRETKSFLDKIMFPAVWLLVADTVLQLILPTSIRQAVKSPYVLAGSLMILGGLMFIAEKKFESREPKIMKVGDLSLKDSFFLGALLVLCLLFGVNTVDIVLPVLLLCGFSRYAAADFSYYFLIPVGIIDGAIRFVRYFVIEQSTLYAQEIFALVITAGFSLLISFFVVRKFLHFTKRHNMKAFSIYKILLGLVILVMTVINSGQG